MQNLTAREKKVLNNMSQVLDWNVSLGTKVEEIIDGLTSISSVGTPVNAVQAAETLSVTGVVVHGETVTIDNPAVGGIDVYEFLADAAQVKTAPTNIAVDISAGATAASGGLTLDTQPTSGDTMTIGTKVYIFVPVGTDTADGEISIGADLAGAQAAIVAAINGTDGVNDPHPLVGAEAFAANAARIYALVGGSAGNTIATTETFTAVTNIFDGATLALGDDCSAADAITALVAAIEASDTQGVGGVDGAGDTVVLTADVGGVTGNAISIAETMANAAFTAAAVNLSGGVNGTETDGLTLMVDETYLYICPVANAISGANWRRLALGG